MRLYSWRQGILIEECLQKVLAMIKKWSARKMRNLNCSRSILNFLFGWSLMRFLDTLAHRVDFISEPWEISTSVIIIIVTALNVLWNYFVTIVRGWHEGRLMGLSCGIAYEAVPWHLELVWENILKIEETLLHMLYGWGQWDGGTFFLKGGTYWTGWY